MYVRTNVAMQLANCITFISGPEIAKVNVLPSEHGFYLLTNKDMNLILKAIADEDKLLEKVDKLQYTEHVWTRTFVMHADIDKYQAINCIANEQLFMQICTDNNIVPLIVSYNCIYALENPELFAGAPGYISVDTSTW